MADQLDLYINPGEKNEKTGNVEMELYAELQNLQDSDNAVAEKEARTGTEDLEMSLGKKEYHGNEEPAGDGRQPGTETGHAVVNFLQFQRSGTAHNWWLALIALLLFLNLCFRD